MRFYRERLVPVVKQTCDRRNAGHSATCDQALGTVAINLTPPCRCTSQMTRGRRAGSSGSSARSTRKTACGSSLTRTSISGLFPTSTASGRTSGITPISLATRVTISWIPPRRQPRIPPGSPSLLSTMQRTFSQTARRIPQPSSKPVRYTAYCPSKLLAMSFACSGTNFPESQARTRPHLQRTALLACRRRGVRASPVRARPW